MSKFITLANSLGLKITAAKVQAINPVIFKAKVNAQAFGNVVVNDGVPTLIDVVANTAEVLTPDSIATAAIAGLASDKPTVFQTVAVSTSEAFGAVTSVTFAKAGGVSKAQNIKDFCKANGLKVTAVEVATQNGIIFSTKGIPSMSGLTESDGKFYQLDLVANTSTIVNAEALSKQATADILAGKDSESVQFVQNFGLITALTLSK